MDNMPYVQQTMPPPTQSIQPTQVVTTENEEPVFSSRELDPIQSLDELRQIEKIQEQKAISQNQSQPIFEQQPYVERQQTWEQPQPQSEGNGFFFSNLKKKIEKNF